MKLLSYKDVFILQKIARAPARMYSKGKVRRLTQTLGCIFIIFGVDGVLAPRFSWQKGRLRQTWTERNGTENIKRLYFGF